MLTPAADRHQSKPHLSLGVDEIRLEGKEPKAPRAASSEADAVELLEKRKLGEVPSFVRSCRSRQG